MSDEEIRRLAEAATKPRPARTCQCDPEKAQHWFDRSICPDPCGQMHYCCSTCLRTVDPCRIDLEPLGRVTLTPDVVLGLLDALEDEQWLRRSLEGLVAGRKDGETLRIGVLRRMLEVTKPLDRPGSHLSRHESGAEVEVAPGAIDGSTRAGESL